MHFLFLLSWREFLIRTRRFKNNDVFPCIDMFRSRNALRGNTYYISIYVYTGVRGRERNQFAVAILPCILRFIKQSLTIWFYSSISKTTTISLKKIKASVYKKKLNYFYLKKTLNWKGRLKYSIFCCCHCHTIGKWSILFSLEVTPT